MVWLLSILLAFALVVAALYNVLRIRKNQVGFARGTVDALLKKRYDLVPNLSEVVRAYAAHEQAVFTELAEARAELVKRARSADLNRARLQREQQLSEQLNELLILAESYPVLKSNEQFLQLQRSLFEVEAQIAAARRFFNAAVNDYNNAVTTFPSNLVATGLGYKPLAYFELTGLGRRTAQLTLDSSAAAS